MARVLLCGVPRSRGACPLPRARRSPRRPRRLLHVRASSTDATPSGGGYASTENGTGRDALDDETAAAGPLPLGVHRRRHWNADQQVLNRGGESVEGCRRDDGDVPWWWGRRRWCQPRRYSDTDPGARGRLLPSAPRAPRSRACRKRDQTVGGERRARRGGGSSYVVLRSRAGYRCRCTFCTSWLESATGKRARASEGERQRRALGNWNLRPRSDWYPAVT